MATFASSSSFSLLPSPPSAQSSRCLSLPFSLLRLNTATSPRPRTLLIAASCSSPSSSSSSSFEDLNFGDSSRSKKLLLSDLIQEIEPLDVSLIQKDVPPTAIDAMKRTISGMLGLLPSNQFQILVEALWEPLSRLLASSMMTGYTLRNAEYRLCLERNLGIHEDNNENQKQGTFDLGVRDMLLDSVRRVPIVDENEVSSRTEETTDNPSEEFYVKDLGEMTSEVQSYIRHLRSRLSSAKKELKEV